MTDLSVEFTESGALGVSFTEDGDLNIVLSDGAGPDVVFSDSGDLNITFQVQGTQGPPGTGVVSSVSNNYDITTGELTTTVDGITGAPVTIQSGGGPSGIHGITVQNEGVPLSGLATTLNFTGPAVRASRTTPVKNITIRSVAPPWSILNDYFTDEIVEYQDNLYRALTDIVGTRGGRTSGPAVAEAGRITVSNSIVVDPVSPGAHETITLTITGSTGATVPAELRITTGTVNELLILANNLTTQADIAADVVTKFNANTTLRSIFDAATVNAMDQVVFTATLAGDIDVEVATIDNSGEIDVALTSMDGMVGGSFEMPIIRVHTPSDATEFTDIALTGSITPNEIAALISNVLDNNGYTATTSDNVVNYARDVAGQVDHISIHVTDQGDSNIENSHFEVDIISDGTDSVQGATGNPAESPLQWHQFTGVGSVVNQFNNLTRILTTTVDGVSSSVEIPGGGTAATRPPLEEARTAIFEGYSRRDILTRDALDETQILSSTYSVRGGTIGEVTSKATEQLSETTYRDTVGTILQGIIGTGHELAHIINYDAKGLLTDDEWLIRNITTGTLTLDITDNGWMTTSDITRVIFTNNGLLSIPQGEFVLTGNGQLMEAP